MSRPLGHRNNWIDDVPNHDSDSAEESAGEESDYMPTRKSRSHMQNELIDLWYSGKYTDLKIKCEDEVWYLHKNVICSQSKPIAAAFDSPFLEANTGEYHFEEEDAKIVGFMLKFMYTGRLDIDTPPSPVSSPVPAARVRVSSAGNTPLHRSMSSGPAGPMPPRMPPFPQGQPSRHYVLGGHAGPGHYVTSYTHIQGPGGAATTNAQVNPLVPANRRPRSPAMRQTFQLTRAEVAQLAGRPYPSRNTPAVRGGSARAQAQANVQASGVAQRSAAGLAPSNPLPPPPPPPGATHPAETSTSSAAAPYSPPPEKDYSDSLKTAVSVYILAEQYDVSALRTLACEKYATIAAKAWDTEAFITDLAHIFDNTMELNVKDPLREAAFQCAARNMNHLVDNSQFQQMCQDRGEVAMAVMKASGNLEGGSSKKRGGDEMERGGNKRSSLTPPDGHSPQCTAVVGVHYSRRGLCSECDYLNNRFLGPRG